MKANNRRQIINEALKEALRPSLGDFLTGEEIEYICSRGWLPDRDVQVIRTIAGTPDHDRVTEILAKLPDPISGNVQGVKTLIRVTRLIEPED